MLKWVSVKIGIIHFFNIFGEKPYGFSLADNLIKLFTFDFPKFGLYGTNSNIDFLGVGDFIFKPQFF